jgi:hypothetical protein
LCGMDEEEIFDESLIDNELAEDTAEDEEESY